ncbi:hypothetical protein V2W45_1468453 [Cenococcum geophilum]
MDIDSTLLESLLTLNASLKYPFYYTNALNLERLTINIACTLRGGEAQATNLAKNARKERRKRKRRVITARGGPVYAGEAREMLKKRKKVFTRWAKLRPTVRNYGKIYGRRRLKGELRRRDESIKRVGLYRPRIKAWPTTKDTTPTVNKWTAEALASAPIVIKDDSNSGENASSKLSTSSASFSSNKLRDYKRFRSDELPYNERIL